MTNETDEERSIDPEAVNDRLRNADLGETVHVRDEHTMHVAGPHQINTRDIDISDIDITDVEIREKTYGSELKLVWEGEAMKTLPRDWEHLPRTSATERGMSRAQRLISTAVTLGVSGLAVLFSHGLMSRLSGDLTINGEPVTYSPVHLVPVVGMVILLALLLYVGFGKGGFPGKAGGHR